MSDSIAVALRVRPLVKSEIDRGCRVVVQRGTGVAAQVFVNQKDAYTFNYVFDSDNSQQEIYEDCVEHKLKKLLEGYNVTILAYGQTGSGKTYTMGTAFNGIMDEHVGVIPRAVHEIFQQTAALKNEYKFKITCSFVELYQEQFFDLFSSCKREESTVEIREDKNGIIMPGLTEVEVQQAEHVTDQLMRGSSGRAVASTAMNETSSRSHAIFTLTVIATKNSDPKSQTISKFNLVDLAGSERCSKTLALGDRFKEGININKGLLALGNVINVLGSSQTTAYVPYRQSKLTRLLQDSLGGNSITLMIACVSPADYNVAETLSTLRYADRALQIKNKPVVNVDPHAAEVMMLKETIQKLRMELLAGGGGGPVRSSIGGIPDKSPFDCQRDYEQLQEALARAEQKKRRLQQELHQALNDLVGHEMRANIAETAHDKLKAHVLELKAKLMESVKSNNADTGDNEQQQLSESYAQHLREITQLVSCVDEELLQTESALQTHREECFNGNHGSEESHSGSEESHEMLQTRTEEHTNKQLNLKDELRDINLQLGLKQELHNRVICNFNKLAEDDFEEKFKQSELKIDQLESERRELLDQLRTTKQKDTSAKLAEERRKRLQILEQEITEMRRKVVQQANLLKMREKEREKIQNLSSDIRVIKESKVKLIRAMRVESERFRQWKLMSEKQLTQLKSKDRKMQSEMVRKETLHVKQRQVLKRKCEEAMATNKRLKDALERQKSAQAQRQRSAKDQPIAAKLDGLVDREMEVIVSLIDAEHSLEQLMEDRAIITGHCNELKQQPQPTEEQTQLLASLEDELEMRNAQITDLQQKVCVNDLESRMEKLCDNFQTVTEFRIINKQLFKTLVQQIREQTQSTMEQKLLLDEQRNELNDVKQQQEELMKRLRQSQSKHEQMMIGQQKSHEEKIALLLRNSNAVSSEDKQLQKIIEDLLSEKEALQKEIDSFKVQERKKKKNKQVMDNDHDIQPITESESEVIDSDPDWVPYIKRSKRTNSSLKGDSMSFEANPNASSNSMNGNSVNESTVTMDETRKGTGSLHACVCRTKCVSKRCHCVLGNSACSSKCRCKGRCLNPANSVEKENFSPSDGMPQNVANNVSNSSSNANDMQEETIAEPKPESKCKSPNRVAKSTLLLSRHSQLNFDTPSSKKKFF